METSAPYSDFKDHLYDADGKLTDLGFKMLEDMFSMYVEDFLHPPLYARTHQPTHDIAFVP